MLTSFFDIKEVIAWDAFAGSGLLGFESLSRGAKYIYFCESSKQVLPVLYKNAAMLAQDASLQKILQDSPDIINTSKRPGLPIFIHPGSMISFTPRHKIDLVFLDPPYLDDPVPYAVHARTVLEGVLVLEASSDKVPKHIPGFTRLKERSYGHSSLSFWETL